MNKNHDEACYLLGEILEKAFNLSALTNNYRYVEKALQYAGNQIVFDEVETYQKMSKNPAFAHIFSHNQAELQDSSYRKRVGGVDYNPPTLNGDVQYLLTTLIFLSSLLIDKYGIQNKQRPLPTI
jgi:hypothetical protein